MGLFLVLSLCLVSGGVWSLPTPHFGYAYMAPTLDKMVVGKYLSKPSPYDGMTAVLKHYGLEEDAINAMREMDQFTEVSIDDEGVLTFVYDVGEESETMSFTPGGTVTVTHPITGDDWEGKTTVLSPTSFVMNFMDDNESSSVLFQFSPTARCRCSATSTPRRLMKMVTRSSRWFTWATH